MPAPQCADVRGGLAAADGPSATVPPSGEGTAGRLEAVQVQAMFDRVAGIYDALNSGMTAGLHHRWRARAADLARVGPGSRVLDVATGTGDLALELARRVAPGGEVVGSDFSEGMLARARAKLEQGRAERSDGRGSSIQAPVVRFEWGDALALPYAADTFDAATVGFGVRNFSDLARGLGELARVVRPGGRVVVLEFTTPTRLPLSLFYRLWFDRVVPLLGRLAGDADAYSYLPESVKRFPPPAALAAELERVGVGELSYLLTAGGIVTIHAGTVSANVRAGTVSANVHAGTVSADVHAGTVPDVHAATVSANGG
jgi:demethylmenaquinone methyltransferase / 2-methoxy-6-polyprenyl-1,4-benzoquinol methylase